MILGQLKRYSIGDQTENTKTCNKTRPVARQKRRRECEVGIPVSDPEDVAMVKSEERRREERMIKRKLGLVVGMFGWKMTDSSNISHRPFLIYRAFKL